MVRLAEASGRDWDELNHALLKDKALRGRLFGVLGSSLALGDHLAANPRSWHLLAGDVTLPSADELRAEFTEAAESASGTNDVRPIAADAVPGPAAGAGGLWTSRRSWRTSRCCRSPWSASICRTWPTPHWPPR